jgi:HEPN domain-containing protein
MKTKLHEEWFKKADEDESSAKIILAEDGPPSTVCFLSQQMAEKYLKGALGLYKQPQPKIHDLLALATLLAKKTPKIFEMKDELKLLNRYYIETRYPGDYPEFSLREAKKALTAAVVIKELILSQVLRKRKTA